MNRSTLSIATVLAVAAWTSGCSDTDDPQLAMCQAVLKQLTNDGIASWDKTAQADNTRARVISIDYTTTANRTGNAECQFHIDPNDNRVATAPERVLLDGQAVGSKELITAGTRASADILKGSAALTAAKTRELADDAKAVAGDVADKARDAAADVADKALDAAADVTRTLQQKLDN